MKITRLARCMSLLLIAGVAAAALPAAAETTARVSLAPQSLDRHLARAVADGNLLGLSVAIVRDGRLVYAGGAGRAWTPGGPPVGVKTRFAIGSLTKQFTAACILLLAEEGKLSIADPVAKWFPELTRASDITLLDLMNMVSGYPDYFPLSFVDRSQLRPVLPTEVIRRYATGRLDFEPGTRCSYSNTNYLILGQVVARVAGQPFPVFLERRVLEPLGMKHTAFAPDVTGRWFARGFSSILLGPPEPGQEPGAGWIDAAGALYSTAGDLAAWDLALLEGKLLRPESFELMTRGRRLADGTLSTYGCGLRSDDRNGTQVIGHGGAVGGFHAQNTMIPASRSAVIVLSNLDNYPAGRTVFNGLLDALLPPPPPAASNAGATQAAVPSPVAGPPIDGPPATEAARQFLLALQAGTVDRAALGEEYSFFLTEERVRGASARLLPLGAVTEVVIETATERGGMEATSLRVQFAGAVVKALMFRTPDGKLQDFALYR